ncbi:MAG TPA: hypothetical protein VN958_03830 [Chitinophagaceae bacterium]|nr:hypothetical protein [Chitinophagaceae bacterium]
MKTDTKNKTTSVKDNSSITIKTSNGREIKATIENDPRFSNKVFMPGKLALAKKRIAGARIIRKPLKK